MAKNLNCPRIERVLCDYDGKVSGGLVGKLKKYV